MMFIVVQTGFKYHKSTREKLRPGFMTHPRVMENNFVKYYPDPTWQYW